MDLTNIESLEDIDVNEVKKLTPKSYPTASGEDINTYTDEETGIAFVLNDTKDKVIRLIRPKEVQPASTAKESKSPLGGLVGKLKGEKKPKTEKSEPEKQEKKDEKTEEPKKEKPERSIKDTLLGIALALILVACIANAALSFLALKTAKTPAEPVPNTPSVPSDPSPSTVTGQTITIMQAKKELLMGDLLTEENVQAYKVTISEYTEKGYVPYDRLIEFVEGEFRAASYIKEGTLLTDGSVRTSPVTASNAWTGNKDLVYFNVVLTDRVLESITEADFGRLITLTVYPKDAPDPDAKIPEGITETVPGDPETRYLVNATVCDIFNEEGERILDLIYPLTQISEKHQKHYLKYYLTQNEGLKERLKPYSATLAINTTQGAFLGNLEQRGRVTGMELTDKSDLAGDKGKQSTAIKTFLKNMDAVLNPPQQEPPAEESNTAENTN